MTSARHTSLDPGQLLGVGQLMQTVAAAAGEAAAEVARQVPDTGVAPGADSATDALVALQHGGIAALTATCDRLSATATQLTEVAARWQQVEQGLAGGTP